ncbi:hypothetical protein [Aurantiacibacter sediminis]|uniref:Protein NO VEIN C-terminal domain-containing protein n=1 Tax=Aurantiacibacter sediminis TaxID=2793064 RepID=A0ABS0N2J0_9SPHN|nr:hypothetical protein [Aurantiacibacter sediminis]MBH5322183.1 hypothetical protein [Aurantiacibacter sediminis]
MGKISDPNLFSAQFGLAAGTLEAAGLIDPFIEVDTPLFIDPLLLGKSAFPQISDDGLKEFKAHFARFVRLLALSKAPNDAPWKGARSMIDLSEPPANGLGYGTTGRSGSSRPAKIKNAIMRTASEVIGLGSRDPEMISLMPFFEEDVGPDTISDFTTHVITPALAQITNDFCIAHGVPMAKNDLCPQIKLPMYKDGSGDEKPLLLVPQDIVRELPIARSPRDIENSINHNSAYRGEVNQFFNAMTMATVEERKEAIRHFALSSKDAFEEFLAMVKEYNSHYDPNDDALGYYKMRDILARGFSGITSPKHFDLSSGPQAVKAVAIDALEVFKHHVENGNLWEELWIDGKPKRERAAQLLFFAIADSFCKANNIDISPEANMGGGPVDFKFSNGYKCRVVVEMKRSGGSVKHGYERQLEIYKNAAQTEIGIFVIMNFGDLGKKLTQIESIKTYREGLDKPASDIIVIDATQKLSASKR